MDFQLPLIPVLWPFLLAVGVYLFQRWVVWAPGSGTSPASLSQHALWVGIIGWVASSLQQAGNAGIIALSGPVALTAPETILPAVLWPVVASLAVHAIGQLSYPGPKRARRLAELSPRKVGDFLPRILAWTTAGIFTAAAVMIGWVSFLPGFDPEPYGHRQAVSNLGFGGDGRIPGTQLASCLGIALAALAAGTWLVLWLISKRRKLEALDAEENGLLRTIAMNRLLRTVCTIAAGLAAIAGSFAARPDPSAGSTGWTNFSAFGAMAVLLIMWWWTPPKLPSQQLGSAKQRLPFDAPGSSHPATRLSASIGAALPIAGLLPIVPALFLLGGPTFAGNSMMAVLIGLLASCVLLAIAAGELLIQRNYGSLEALRAWPRQAVGGTLLTMAIIVFLLLIVVLILTAAGEAELNHEPSWVPAAIMTGVVVLASVPAFMATRLRQGIEAAGHGLDTALRAITIYRIVRSLSAYAAAQAGMALITTSYALQALFSPETAQFGTWPPAMVAGVLLLATAVVIAFIPVRALAGRQSGPVQRAAEAAK